MKSNQDAKVEADKLVQDIKRATRRKFSAEEKIRIVLASLRGEDSIIRDGIYPRALCHLVVSACHSVSSQGLGFGRCCESVGPLYYPRPGGGDWGCGWLWDDLTTIYT